MQLVRDRNRLGRAIAVLGENEIRLSPTRIIPFEGVRPVQQDHDVSILFETIMQIYPVGNEIVSAVYSSVINIMLTNAGNLDNPIPEDIARRQSMNLSVFKCRRYPMQQGPSRRMFRPRLAKPRLRCGLELGRVDRLADQRFSHRVPSLNGQRVRTGTTAARSKLFEHNLC